MDANSPRWHEISRSPFPHEQEGLDRLREMLPDAAPFHAWTNFEFRDRQGKWHEIDALVLGERRLHLVELKHYQGTLGGNAYVWQRGRRSEDTPLRRTRSNAQRLSSLIKEELQSLAPGLDPREFPWVQECVFLHADSFRCQLPPGDRTDLFGLDGRESSSNLPSLAERLLEPTDGRRRPLIEADDLLAQLFERIGFGMRREREVGSWRLIAPTADGDDWQDWDAEHQIVRTDKVRVRFFVTAPGAAESERTRTRALVMREYDVTKRLRHEGLANPQGLVEDELGIGLVYPTDPSDRRLDLWLADHVDQLSLEQQVRLVRQLAETMKYVHQRHIVHRALNPRAITVTAAKEDEPVLKVGDWQFAGAERTSANAPSRGTATRLFAAADEARSGAADDPAGAYLAPEGRWNSDVDRIRLDVFALGAVAYLIFAGRPPASDGPELRLRLQRDQGLDLAADVPELPVRLRDLVLQATHPVVSERLSNADAFLAMLDDAERADSAVDDVEEDDPLELPPGAKLGDRYEIVRRLGSGSTAVGLLVADLQNDRERVVLKVALNDRAQRRLADEAEILTGLNQQRTPRLVRLIDGPIQIGSRQALVLESAGEETLADVLRGRHRLSIDRLERWGSDLLEAVVALDKANVDHRDIKPANLGVREQRGDRSKHLVLFDFSLGRAGASAVEAGTPPYLDPFLGPPKRPTYDSAAERYAAAVTLFEMATGNPRGPKFGDGESDPTMVRDEASLDAGTFDPSIAGPLMDFFTKSFRRDATDRLHTAAEMLTAWRSIFSTPETTTVPEETDALADSATPATPLVEAGLTARALSALEPLQLVTVGDLVAQDSARITRLSGVGVVTRGEIVKRAKQWRSKFGQHAAPSTPAEAAPLGDVVAIAEQLCEIAAGSKAPARRQAARIVLGLEGDADPFGTLAQLAEATGKGGSPQMSTLLAELQTKWTNSDVAAPLLDRIAERTIAAIAGFGGVAVVTDVVGYLLDSSADDVQRRVATGLVRAALDRADDVDQGAGDPPTVIRRRLRARRIVLLATDAQALDASAALGAAADELLRDAIAAGESLVPAVRAAAELSRLWPAQAVRPADRKLVRLAARLSERAAASARGELHDRELDPAAALRLAVGTLAPGQQMSVEQLVSLVRTRFPMLPPIPARPRLDQLVTDADLDLAWDGDRYVVPNGTPYTTGMTSHTSLTLTPVSSWHPGSARRGVVDTALDDSRGSRSFLALGVPRQRRLDDAAAQLERRYNADQLDLTEVLIEALRTQAQTVGISWDTVTAADAAEHEQRAWRGLSKLVQDAAPAIEQTITTAASTPSDGRPLLMVEAGPLARYNLMPILARLADITTAHARAVWLLLPLDRTATPALDGTPLQISHGGQFVALDEAWFTAALEADPA